MAAFQQRTIEDCALAVGSRGLGSPRISVRHAVAGSCFLCPYRMLKSQGATGGCAGPEISGGGHLKTSITKWWSGVAHAGVGSRVPYRTAGPQELTEMLCDLRLRQGLRRNLLGACDWLDLTECLRKWACRERRLGAHTRQQALRS